MEKKFKKIGVLTSGGDAPGMNAVIKSVTCAAIDHGLEVVGIIGGYSGLLYDKTRILTENDVSGIVSKGGTMLYSDRCKEYNSKEGVAKASKYCRDKGIDGVIVVGGDGTFRGATDLSNSGIPCIGVTGTIDNDITASDITVGYDTAMNTVVSLCDSLRDTFESHARCVVVKVMGRDAGYIAIEAGLAVNAIGVAIKEKPFDKEALFNRMIDRKRQGQRSFIVIVSEGCGDEFAANLPKEIEEKTGIESRFVSPEHIVRGGTPTLVDRNFASKSGYKAVELLLQGISDVVVCSRRGEIVPMEINYALVLDRMYKGKLKDGDLERFTKEQIAEMEAICEERRAYFDEMYKIVNAIGC